MNRRTYYLFSKIVEAFGPFLRGVGLTPGMIENIYILKNRSIKCM